MFWKSGGKSITMFKSLLQLMKDQGVGVPIVVLFGFSKFSHQKLYCQLRFRNRNAGVFALIKDDSIE